MAKGYYSLTYEAEKEPANIWFNYVYGGGYSLEVNEADGLETNGKASGKFYFEVQDENFDTCELDWENIDDLFSEIEAEFSFEDEDGNPIEFTGTFEMTIYDNEGNPHHFETTELL